jgi:RNA polymerase sigma-70 factor (ECF subfamily)
MEALRVLPRKQRAAVVLHHGAGYPVRDVARIIGSTPAAVRVHLSRGRRRLRELLGGDDD